MSLLPAVVLAGGLATRLRPITETIPKSMVDIHGEPFIAHQLRLLRGHGIQDVVLCLGYLGEQVEHYVGDGERFGVSVQYVYDGPTLLGTAGAIKRALPVLAKESPSRRRYAPPQGERLNGAFFVLYGDSFLPCDYKAVQETFARAQKPALMTVFHNQGLWDTSNVEFRDHQIVIYDKKQRNEHMAHIDYGLEIFHPSCFDSIPDNTPYDLADLFQLLLKKNQLAAHEVKERFYEVGSFAGIEELMYYLSHQSPLDV